MTAKQISFDPLDFGGDDELSHKAAMKARNAKLREVRSEGQQARGWTLTNQCRPWASFGVPDGRVRNIYYISTGV